MKNRFTLKKKNNKMNNYFFIIGICIEFKYKLKLKNITIRIKLNPILHLCTVYKGLKLYKVGKLPKHSTCTPLYLELP